MMQPSGRTYSRARSTKTRIETNSRPVFAFVLYIREQDPLKQGLKRNLAKFFHINTYSRARSTKTRIETLQLLMYIEYGTYSRARSTKTRIETSVRLEFRKNSIMIREQDPLKQGLKLKTLGHWISRS